MSSFTAVCLVVSCLVILDISKALPAIPYVNDINSSIASGQAQALALQQQIQSETASKIAATNAEIQREIQQQNLRNMADSLNPEQLSDYLNAQKFGNYVNPQQLSNYANTQKLSNLKDNLLNNFEKFDLDGSSYLNGGVGSDASVSNSSKSDSNSGSNELY